MRGVFALGIFCGIIYGLATGAGIPFIFEEVFPRIFSYDPESPPSNWAIIGYAALIPTVFIIRGISGFLNSTCIGYCGLSVLERLRQQIFEKLLSVEVSWLQSFSSGDLISRVTGDTALIQTTITEVANDIVKQPITFLGAFSILVYLSFQDGQILFILFCLGAVPLMVFPLRYFGKKLMVKAREQQETLGSITSVVSESLASSREIRAYSLEARQAERFHIRLKRHLKAQLRVIAYGFALSPSIEIISAFGIAGAFLYSYYAGIPLESFLALAAALYFSYDPIKKMGTIHNRLKKGIGALDRIEPVLHQPAGPIEKIDTEAFPPSLGSGLIFDHIDFSYDKEPVLRNLSLQLKPGECVALVGTSGAGKTTLMNLIVRLFDPGKGGVSIDGVDLRDLKLEDLRHHLAVVPQEPTLFPDTISANIRLGNPGASEEQVIAAATMAGLHETVQTFEVGYDTIVGDGAGLLSGGQKQRLALARAFLRNAPILLLDEPTSALDGENEASLRANLQSFVEDKITIIIAHRYETLKLCNRVVVLDAGEVVGDGTLEELTRHHPTFRRVFSLQ